jgi:hypothetical protein
MITFTKKTKKRFLVSGSVIAIFGSIGIYVFLTHYWGGIIHPLGERIPYSTVKFDAEEGVEFHQPSGSHITVPGGVLRDQTGKRVRGTVTLKFREFHTANEIFLSGIPMQFGNKRASYFNSGGMMELRITQNGENLSIEKGKHVDVELASAIKPDADYRLFYLTDGMAWDNGRNFETINNDRRDAALATMPSMPAAPIDPSPENDAFLFTIASNNDMAPQLRVWNDVQWQLVKIEGQLSALDALRVIWDQTNIVKSSSGENLYEISYKFNQADYQGKIHRFEGKIYAKPVLEGNELATAEAQYAKDVEKYALTTARLNAEQERLMLEAGILNKFTISEFGIYNIDKIEKLDMIALVDVAFDFENELNPLINQVMLYVILEDQRGVIKFNAADWDEIPAITGRCSFAAVLPDGTVAYVSSAEYLKKINTKTVSKDFQNTIYFRTKRISYDEFVQQILPSDDLKTPRFI